MTVGTTRLSDSGWGWLFWARAPFAAVPGALEADAAGDFVPIFGVDGHGQAWAGSFLERGGGGAEQDEDGGDGEQGYPICMSVAHWVSSGVLVSFGADVEKDHDAAGEAVGDYDAAQCIGDEKDLV